MKFARCFTFFLIVVSVVSDGVLRELVDTGLRRQTEHLRICATRCAKYCFDPTRVSTDAKNAKCAAKFVEDRCFSFPHKETKAQAQTLCIEKGEASSTNCGPATCVDATTGGTIKVANLASLDFAAGMFGEDTTVALKKTQDPAVNAAFDGTASMFRPSTRLSYEMVIKVSSQPLLADIPATINVPPAFAAAVPTGEKMEVFALIVMSSKEDGPAKVFELLPGSVYDATSHTIRIVLPAIVFSPSGNGQWQATLTLAPTPGTFSSRLRRLQAAVCQGPSVRCPIEGGCTVTSPFSSSRTLGGTTRPHFGTDYRAAEGTNILAAANGVIERIRFDANGYGNYVILRHEDDSATLYAHLSTTLVSVGDTVEAGTVIAESGNTGRSTGPHLHFELVPNGEIIQSKNRIDPDPCIGQVSQGSITAGDNGNVADDAFKLTLNGVVLGTTTIGGTNTLSTNNLIPGTFELTLEVVLAPDDVGTWFIQLNDGLTFADGTTYATSEDPEWAIVTFTVVVP